MIIYNDEVVKIVRSQAFRNYYFIIYPNIYIYNNNIKQMENRLLFMLVQNQQIKEIKINN